MRFCGQLKSLSIHIIFSSVSVIFGRVIKASKYSNRWMDTGQQINRQGRYAVVGMHAVLVPDIQYYPVSSQESGIRLDPVSGRKRYLVLSGILYLVESRIRYYLFHY